MKIEQLIVQHLYNTKTVTLQGIGTIHLNPSVVLPTAEDKDATIPENAFSFEYNLKAGEDDALIAFIVQQTRKIKPLASSDLESYSILAKQFLNIGKPLSIEGVGNIQKNQAGEYEFKQGSFITPKIDDIAREVKVKNVDNISFESEAPKSGNSKKMLMAAVVFVFIALTGLGLYYFIFKTKEPAVIATVEPAPQQLTDTAKTDTTQSFKPDTTANAAPVQPVITDTTHFKVVVKQYSSEATVNKAFKTYTSWGYKMEIIKIDSTNYQLAIPFNRPFADTSKAMDSLKRIFQGKTYILLNKQ
ncbi:MAG: hypothetical protein IPP72_19265 [Chitinophagaceae bacterium]|nr:hypothetical protein [Chitinophagaceae bacterium]